MISRETICEELEKQLLANGMNCGEILLDCSMTPCGQCYFWDREENITCWDAQKQLAKTIKRKLLLKKLLEE